MICYGYIRVSTKKQAEEGNSLEVQKVTTEAYWAKHLKEKGYEWGGNFIDDGIKAGVRFSDRPAGSQLDDRLRRGDCIVFPYLCRGFRSVEDMANHLGRWREQDIVIHAIDKQLDSSTSVGRLCLYVIVMVAEMENEMRADRVRATAHKRRNVTKYKKRPEQYRRRGTRWVRENKEWALQEDPEEATTVRIIFDMHEAGESFYRIKRELEKRDIRNYYGRHWSTSAIHRAYTEEKARREIDARRANILEEGGNGAGDIGPEPRAD